MKAYYFDKFEDRRPYSPVTDNTLRSVVFQVSGALTVLTGIVYMHWRWTSTINPEALFFSIVLLMAETFSFFGICLFVFDLWKSRDAERKTPPHYLSEVEELCGRPDRPLRVDVFIATLNEEADLVRYTIRDAKKMDYPFPDVKIRIYLLDDGRRDGRDPAKENVKELCREEGITYLTRESNEGYKAGNLRNGLRHSNGDIFVILDADSRPFKNFLVNTLGYFKKQTVAWVQTCHWFYDTTPSMPLSEYLIRTFHVRNERLRSALRFFSPGIKTGEDIFGSDPRQFYEVILRRRNYHNAAFCCGAASVHRREAVMNNALRVFASGKKQAYKFPWSSKKTVTANRIQLVKENELTPFVYHASEDLYTSMVIQSDTNKKWESVLHPHVECKLLSPQDIGSFVKQRRRYAEGSVDIFFRDNPLFKSGLTWKQKLCYFHTVYSYFSCIWIFIFLMAPVIYFFTDILPVRCSMTDFLSYFLPLFICTRIADAAGSWGVSQKRGKQYYISLFWINILSIVSVVSGKKIKFNVTSKTRQQANPLKFAWPHMLIILLTLAGIGINVNLAFDPEHRLAYLLNVFWGMVNVYNLNVYVRAAFWTAEEDTEASNTQEPELKPINS